MSDITVRERKFEKVYLPRQQSKRQEVVNPKSSISKINKPKNLVLELNKISTITKPSDTPSLNRIDKMKKIEQLKEEGFVNTKFGSYYEKYSENLEMYEDKIQKKTTKLHNKAHELLKISIILKKNQEQIEVCEYTDKKEEMEKLNNDNKDIWEYLKGRYKIEDEEQFNKKLEKNLQKYQCISNIKLSVSKDGKNIESEFEYRNRPSEYYYVSDYIGKYPQLVYEKRNLDRNMDNVLSKAAKNIGNKVANKEKVPYKEKFDIRYRDTTNEIFVLECGLNSNKKGYCFDRNNGKFYSFKNPDRLNISIVDENDKIIIKNVTEIRPVYVPEDVKKMMEIEHSARIYKKNHDIGICETMVEREKSLSR
ncbi:MAG: hypothetical protein Ta2D_10710 [Rickettsiales bacterium]|nr:MAG: hypothetical protein Ta2D_10710 [Rickettsiales bacterium]